jgi:hypothetical protein
MLNYIIKREGVPGAKKVAYIGGGHSSTYELFFPTTSVHPAFPDWLLSLQNIGATATEMEVHFLNRDGSLLAKRNIIVQPSSSGYFSTANIQDILEDPQGWSGAVYITAQGEKIFGTSTNCQEFYCLGNESLSIGDSHWFVPAMNNDISVTGDIKVISVLGIMNTSKTNHSDVTVSFPKLGLEEKFTLPPLGSVNISSEELPDLPPDSTAEIRSEGAEVAVTAQYLNYIAEQGAAYNGLAVGRGGTDLFFPDVSWAEERQADTMIYLQNLSGTETIPTLFLYDRVTGSDEGSTPPIEAQLAPLGAYQTLVIDVQEYLGERANFEWEGSAVIKGDAEMGAIIITRSDGEGQWATAYNAAPGY